MVKLTALQCAPLLLPLAHSFILPPPDLLSAFDLDTTDNKDVDRPHSLFGSVESDPFLDLLLSADRDMEDEPTERTIIIIDDATDSSLGGFNNPFSSLSLGNFGSDPLASLFDQISGFTPSLPKTVPSANEVYEKMEWLVASRFDALEQKIGTFQNMIKDQVDELLSSTKKGEEKAVSWDLDEITSLDQLRRWDVNAWLTPESENEDDLEAWHHHHHHHGPDHKHNHDHDHKHHHLPGHDEDGPPEGAIQPEATLLDMLRQTHHSSHFLDFLSDFPEIEKRLDDHSHNLTVFVPSNDAFDRILKGKKKEDLKLPKEDIEKLLKYHIMDGYHDYDGLKWHNTIASEMEDHELGQDEKQRLRIGLYRCPTVNLYSEILIKDYIGKNGVIHAVDSIILPPPSISTILNLLPSHFSTTLLALHKTGLIDQLSAHDGSNKYTIFAPSNSAWNHIPMKITAFLFSEHGKEYLEAVMKYHIVENRVIYSDGMIGDRQDPGGIETHFPAGYHHLTAHSLLTHKNKDEGRDESGALNIDITRFPSMLSFRVNGHSDIMIANGVARDGVIHIPNHILMPPCQDLPDHGHHDESADAPHRDLKKRWSLFGWGRGEEKKVEKEVETKSCVDMSMVIEDSEEGLEAWKRSWERYL